MRRGRDDTDLSPNLPIGPPRPRTPPQVIQYACRYLWWYYSNQADAFSKERGARFEKVRPSVLHTNMLRAAVVSHRR